MTSVQLLGVWNIIGWIKDWRQNNINKKADLLAIEKYSKIDISTLMQERYDVARLESPGNFDNTLSVKILEELRAFINVKPLNSKEREEAEKAMSILQLRVNQGFISTSQLAKILEVKTALISIRKENEKV